MLILLPPSEGKACAPEPAAPVDLAALTSAAELTDSRVAILDALAAVSARPDALDVLGVGATLADEVDRNTRLRSEPAAPAALVYTGVLYSAARLATSLPASALDSIRVISALWGAVSPLDTIPAYRLSMGVTLPGIGPLAATWRAPLAGVLDNRTRGDVIVDARSADYVAAWRPRPGEADWVSVRVVHETNGRRTVVTHNAKHTRGVLAGHLVRRNAPPPSSADGLLDAARELTGTVIGRAVGTGLDFRLIEAHLHRASSRSAATVLELVLR